MAPRRLDWDKLLSDYLNLFTVGVEQQASYGQLAGLLGTQTNAITQISVILKVIGALRVREESPKGKRGGGRAFYTILLDEPEVRRRLKNRGWDVGNRKDYDVAAEIGRREGLVTSYGLGRPPRAQRGTPDNNGLSQRLRVAIGTDREGGQVAIAGEEPARPFSQLAPMRKDEPRALVEAAKAYRDREAFINEEIAKFQSRGMTISREAIGGTQVDPLMENVCLVLPYVEELERANDRLTGQVKSAHQPQADLARARQTADDQRRQIERLIAEKSNAADLMANERRQHREQIQVLNRQLEAANRALLEVRNVGGGKEVVKRVGQVIEDSVKTESVV